MTDAIDTGFLHEAENVEDISRIRYSLARDLKKADILVICDHKTRPRSTRCSIRTILTRDDGGASLGMREGDSIKRHTLRIPSDEDLEGMVSLYTVNGEWIESSAIYTGKIKRIVRNPDGTHLGHEFPVEQIIQIFKSANKASHSSDSESTKGDD